MKKVSSLIIIILLVAVIALVLTSKQNTAKYEDKEKELEAQLDSVKALQHQADLHAIQVMTELQTAKSELAYQSKVTEKYKLRYETLRHTAAPHLTDAGIDSAVNRLYKNR